MGAYDFIEEQCEAFAFTPTGAAGLAGSVTRGCTLARSNTGLYDITLSRALDSLEACMLLSHFTTDQTGFFANTSDTVKAVAIRSLAPAAADGGFVARISRFAYGAQ